MTTSLMHGYVQSFGKSSVDRLGSMISFYQTVNDEVVDLKQSGGGRGRNDRFTYYDQNTELYKSAF